MNDALAKMIDEIQQVRSTYGNGGVGNVSQAEANAFRAAQQGINNQSDMEYMPFPSALSGYIGGVGNVSNQETQMFNEMLNNIPTGGSGLGRVATTVANSVGNMSDMEYMRANNNTGGVGNVSNQEMKMFNEMANSIGNNFTSPIEEMRALQQKGASGAGFLSDVEINRFMQLRNQLNPNLPQEKPLATVLEPVDIDGAGQMSIEELTRFLQNSERLGRSGN